MARSVGLRLVWAIQDCLGFSRGDTVHISRTPPGVANPACTATRASRNAAIKYGRVSRFDPGHTESSRRESDPSQRALRAAMLSLVERRAAILNLIGAYLVWGFTYLTP
jgi:hypothetical protein